MKVLNVQFYLEPRDRINQLQDKAVKQDGRLGFFTTNIGKSIRLNGRSAATASRDSLQRTD